MPNFDHNSVLRGAQLTIVGAYRALQNPQLFESKHYRQAFIAVMIGLFIRVALCFPVIGIRMVLWFVGLFADLRTAHGDDRIINGLDFIQETVLQLPFFLMSAMRFVTPTLDEMFMTSLDWVDSTYLAKHASEHPSQLRPLYSNLKMYSVVPVSGVTKNPKGPYEAILAFILRYSRKAVISITFYSLSFSPYIGRFILPTASFYSFKKAVGTLPAFVIFGIGVCLPRRWIVIFLQGFFASRSLMLELLEPYFSRINYTNEQKKAWFREREGVLFGFGVGYYFLIKIPLLGVLIYGIAEASTAYLITKITKPPPPPAYSAGFAEGSLQWTNKHEFLKLNIVHIDGLDIATLENLSGKSSDVEKIRQEGYPIVPVDGV